MPRGSAREPANFERPPHNRTLVGCEKLSASSFREHSLRLECRQERDMPVNKVVGDNVKTETQSSTSILAIRQCYSSLGPSEILSLVGPFCTIRRFGRSCHGLQRS